MPMLHGGCFDGRQVRQRKKRLYFSVPGQPRVTVYTRCSDGAYQFDGELSEQVILGDRCQCQACQQERAADVERILG